MEIDVVVTPGHPDVGGVTVTVAFPNEKLLPAITVIVAAGDPQTTDRSPEADRFHPVGSVPLYPHVQPELGQFFAASCPPLVADDAVTAGAAGHVCP